jgi:hypothetical protein
MWVKYKHTLVMFCHVGKIQCGYISSRKKDQKKENCAYIIDVPVCQRKYVTPSRLKHLLLPRHQSARPWLVRRILVLRCQEHPKVQGNC